jgi:hypothetical protein
MFRLLGCSIRRIGYRNDWRRILRESKACRQNTGQQPASNNRVPHPH